MHKAHRILVLLHDSPPWGRESWIWRTQVVKIPLKSRFVSPLQELLYLLRPPILSDGHVDDTRMSNFMSYVMQDVTILSWRTPRFFVTLFPFTPSSRAPPANSARVDGVHCVAALQYTRVTDICCPSPSSRADLDRPDWMVTTKHTLTGSRVRQKPWWRQNLFENTIFLNL